MWSQKADREPHSANLCPGSALSEKAHFPQYWPFRANSPQVPVNQKRSDLVVEMFGSASGIRT
jgi:hypothetical protein